MALCTYVSKRKRTESRGTGDELAPFMHIYLPTYLGKDHELSQMKEEPSWLMM